MYAQESNLSVMLIQQPTEGIMGRFGDVGPFTLQL